MDIGELILKYKETYGDTRYEHQGYLLSIHNEGIDDEKHSERSLCEMFGDLDNYEEILTKLKSLGHREYVNFDGVYVCKNIVRVNKGWELQLKADVDSAIYNAIGEVKGII